MPQKRWTNGRRALVAVTILLTAYLAALALLMSQETALVFQAGRPLGEARPAFPFEQVSIDRSDGARQFAWTMRAPGESGTWVLFLHGNSATIASRVNIARYGQLRALGLHVFAPEYRGFGGLDGVPTEATLAADAGAAYEHLRQRLGVPADRIVIYGWSLGSAVAVATAASLPQAAVILEGAPASLVDIGQQQYPFFPIRMIMRNRFESIASIDRIHSPLLFLHSPEDAVIPIREGRRLYEAARAPKRFVEVRGGHIYANDVDRAVFEDAIRAFLAGLGLIATEEH
jgi:pimeloyl-ACP methyl ester carboxylesterase